MRQALSLLFRGERRQHFGQCRKSRPRRLYLLLLGAAVGSRWY